MDYSMFGQESGVIAETYRKGNDFRKMDDVIRRMKNILDAK